jgi:hypothetical protein
MHGPHEFAKHVREAALAEPSIAQNEVKARHSEVAGYGKGTTSWKDRLAVGIGLGLLAAFGGGFFWHLFS